MKRTYHFLTYTISILLLPFFFISCASKTPPPGERGASPLPAETVMKEPPVQEGGEQPQVVEEELVALQNLQEKAAREGAFGDVYFDFNVYTLKEESKATMTKTAEWLTTHPTVSIMIEGHCDERGTQEYNLALGERRGASVQKYLYSLGIDLARMQTISYGEERPADPGHDEEAWAKNRRVHFTITKR